jgi:hypothetical protein
VSLVLVSVDGILTHDTAAVRKVAVVELPASLAGIQRGDLYHLGGSSMARLIIGDSETVLFLLAHDYSYHYARCIEVKSISFDESGIRIALHGPLYEMARIVALAEGNQFTLDIQNCPCGPPGEYNNERSIILIEGCKIVVQYIEKAVRWISYRGDPNILEMHVDIAAGKATIYNYDDGEEILTWHAQS